MNATISVKIIQRNFSVKYLTVLFVEISRDKNKALRKWGLKFIKTYVMRTYKYEIFSSNVFLEIKEQITVICSVAR